MRFTATWRWGQVGLFAVAAAAMAAPSGARADLVKVTYEATVSTVLNQPFGLTVPLNTPVTGYLQYDTSTSDITPSEDYGDYPHSGGGAFLAQFLGHKVTGSTTPWVEVDVPPGANHTLRIWDGPRTVGPEGGVMAFDDLADEDITMLLAITPKSSSLLPDDHLPDPFPAFNFGFLGDPHTFTLYSSQSDGMHLKISSMTQVPEPESLLLALAAGLGVAWWTSRRGLAPG